MLQGKHRNLETFAFLTNHVCLRHADILKRIGYTLAATALTDDQAFIAECMACPNIERLNIGPLPTNRLTWDQPHEGNLFTHLYRQRALQFASV